MTYTIDGKQGRSAKVDQIATFVVTASGSAAEIPRTLGRRDYIKIANNSAVPVKLLSSATTSGTDGFTIGASGGTFEDNTNAPFYIVSTGADAVVNIYERKNK